TMLFWPALFGSSGPTRNLHENPLPATCHPIRLFPPWGRPEWDPFPVRIVLGCCAALGLRPTLSRRTAVLPRPLRFQGLRLPWGSVSFPWIAIGNPGRVAQRSAGNRVGSGSRIADVVRCV